MRQFERSDELMHAYLLIDDREVQRAYGERDTAGERRHLRRAVLRATICLALLGGGLAVGDALQQHELNARIHLLPTGG